MRDLTDPSVVIMMIANLNDACYTTLSVEDFHEKDIWQRYEFNF